MEKDQKDSPIQDSYQAFNKAYVEEDKEKYVLRIFISGLTSRSLEAIKNLRKICEEQLEGRYSLEVIDISQQPEVITKENIVATPTLVKELPKPIRRIIGDLSNTDHVIVALNLAPKKIE